RPIVTASRKVTAPKVAIALMKDRTLAGSRKTLADKTERNMVASQHKQGRRSLCDCLEHIKNKMKTNRKPTFYARPALPGAAAVTNLRLGHPAAWAVGPVAIQAVDAPFDAPLLAGHAEVLGDRIIDRPPHAVRHQRDGTAEAAWNRVMPPRIERRLAD